MRKPVRGVVWPLIGLLVLALPSPARASMTVRDYVAYEQGSVEGADPEAALTYLWGVLDGIGSVAALTGVGLYCIAKDDPKIGLLRLNAFKALVSQRIKAMAAEPGGLEGERGSVPVGQVVVGLLNELFPCPAKPQDG